MEIEKLNRLVNLLIKDSESVDQYGEAIEGLSYNEVLDMERLKKEYKDEK